MAGANKPPLDYSSSAGGRKWGALREAVSGPSKPSDRARQARRTARIGRRSVRCGVASRQGERDGSPQTRDRNNIDA
eukprot:4663915-Pyramimonas_sp.AAC.1